MRANELMVGDWVKVVSCPLPLKVRSVEDGKIGLYHSVLWNNSIGWTRIDVPSSTYEEDVVPIPLTDEMLQKNFPDTRYGVFWCWDDRKRQEEIWYEVRIEKDYETVFMLDIRYVHELQHVIRLCGIEKEIVL